LSDESILNLERKNLLHGEVVFADGIGSSGKGMLSHILSSLTRIEKQQNHISIDYISTIHWLGKIQFDAAKTYLLSELDMHLYHAFIGRDMNFRFRDSTSIFTNAKILNNFFRLLMPAGDAAIERIKKNRPILNEAPHDALRNAQFFFDCFDKLKIIYIIRDPIDLIEDWKRRGFGKRIGSDRREFQFSINYNGEVKPIYLLESDKKYQELSEIQRIIIMIKFCFKQNLEGFEKLGVEDKKKILFTSFDSLCKNPRDIVKNICFFLNVKTTKATNKILRKEKLPRSILQRATKAEFINLYDLDDEFKEELDKIYDYYHTFIQYIKSNNL